MQALAIGLLVFSAGCAGDPPGEDGEDATPGGSTPTPSSEALRVSEDHDFSKGPREIPVEVKTMTKVQVEMWFEGNITREDALSIQLRDPDGQPLVQARNPPGVPASTPPGGRSFDEYATVTLKAGTWSIAFVGTGNATGHARIVSV